MWKLDYKEGLVLKNWCFWIVLLEKTLESPLDCKETKAVNPKGNQSWIFIGRTDAEADAPIIWPPDTKSQLTRKDPNAGKDWRWEEKGTREDEMVKWHHWLNGDEFEQTPGDGEGQGSPVVWSPWVTKKQTKLSDWTTTANVGIQWKIKKEKKKRTTTTKPFCLLDAPNLRHRKTFPIS